MMRLTLDHRTRTAPHGDPLHRWEPLSEDPERFRTWLASLPPTSTLPETSTHEPFILWLRAVGDPNAALLQNPDGSWQDYRYRGRRWEVPGCFFYWYDEWEPEWTVAEGIAAFDAWMREYWGEIDEVWPW